MFFIRFYCYFTIIMTACNEPRFLPLHLITKNHAYYSSCNTVAFHRTVVFAINHVCERKVAHNATSIKTSNLNIGSRLAISNSIGTGIIDYIRGIWVRSSQVAYQATHPSFVCLRKTKKVCVFNTAVRYICTSRICHQATYILTSFQFYVT